MSRPVVLTLAIGLIAALAVMNGFRNQRSATGSEPNGSPVVTLTEELSEGRMDVTIIPMGNRTFQIDVRLAALSAMPESEDLNPNASFAIVEMRMDRIVPVFSVVSPGVWQANAVLPMAGTWLLNIGFGEEFAETILVAQ